MTANSHRHSVNRHNMALRLADVLASYKMADSRTVAALPASGRRMVEALSGEKRQASDETWAVVVEILSGWEARKTEAALRMVDDERVMA